MALDTAESTNPPASYRHHVFVSYGRVEPDTHWAVWAQNALEGYRTPRRLRAEGIPLRVGSVFRDETDLAATNDLPKAIRNELEHSQFLLVICSPRARNRKWINDEIAYFQGLGREERVLTLLIDGEPEESFPIALRPLHEQLVKRRASGVFDELQPLAADVRPREGESERSRRRTARLRLLAPLIGCRFDDLRRRENERVVRRWFLAASAAIVVAITLGTLAILWRAERDTSRKERDRNLLLLANASLTRAQELVGESHHAAALAHLSRAMETMPSLVGPRALAFHTLLYRSWPLLLTSTMPSDVQPVALSGNGTVAVGITSGARLRLWRTQSGASVGPDTDVDGTLLVARLSYDGTLLLTATVRTVGTTQVTIYNVANGAVVESSSIAGNVVTASFSPIGRNAIWSYTTTTRASTFSAGVMAISVPGSTSHESRVWLGPQSHSLTLGHRSAVIASAIDAQGRRAFVKTSDGRAAIWSLDERLLEHALTLPDGLASVEFSPDGSLFSGIVDRVATRWAIEGEPNRIELRHDRPVTAVTISAGDRSSVSITDDGVVRVWDTNGQLRGEPIVSPSPVLDARLIEGLSEVVTLSADRTRRWHIGRPPAAELPVDTAGLPLVFGSTLDSESVKGRVNSGSVEWDLVTGSVIRGQPVTFVNGVGSFNAIQSNPVWRGSLANSGNFLALGAWADPPRMAQASVEAFDVRLAHSGSINSFQQDLARRRVLTASSDDTALISDVETGRPTSPPMVHKGAVWSAAFDPAYERVITASNDREANV